ncbi:hypothetical protein [Dokdonia sp.]|uniref:hypothetical protein n=1 Tax=Dokdonia sp. TaxID=2024995 RepID=UPI003266FE97
MKHLIIPLVNWGIGTILIGVFAFVCIIIALIVYNMIQSDKKDTKAREFTRDQN